MTTDTREAPDSGTRAAAPGRRLLALDGLRGLTIVLVVLGHLSAFLWPLEGIRSTPWLRGLVAGGAVPVFFVVSGYIVTAGLLRDDARGSLDPVRFYAGASSDSGRRSCRCALPCCSSLCSTPRTPPRRARR